MAEMKWLATDFVEERKRHSKWRKLINKGVLSVAKEKEQEKIRKREVFPSFIYNVVASGEAAEGGSKTH